MNNGCPRNLDARQGAYGYALSRDSAGRIAKRSETGMAGAHAWAYAYDALGRLTSATRDGTLAESYAYDGDGNRVAFRAPLRGVVATVTAAFDAEDRVVACGSDAYTFAADGFLAAKRSEAGTTAYAYSPLGELAAVALPDGRAVTYAYDGAGRRVSRSVDGTVTQRYLWADATHLLAVCDGAGAVQARFLYADARVPYAADTPGGRVFLHYDQVGSLRAVTDTGGVLIRTIERDSFGVVLSDTDTASPIPFGFAGGLADPDTGLVLFGARDYDPALGRWCAKDPIGFAGGDANLYGYCVGDPVGLADPAGLYSVSAADASAFCGETTTEEKALVVLYVLGGRGDVAYGVYQASRLAKREMLARYGAMSGEIACQQSNAFVHAYWSALVTSWYGAAVAEQFLTAHEGEGALNATPLDKAMDLANNALGRTVGGAAATSDSALANLVNQVVRHGGATIKVGGRLVRSDGSAL